LENISDCCRRFCRSCYGADRCRILFPRYGVFGDVDVDFTLWQIQFLVPMPVIERNKNDNKILYSLSFFVSVFLAVDANTLLQEQCPATHGFSRGVLVYSLAYLVVSLLLAGWLKIKEKRKNK
jgi:hypothetical protein